MKPWQVLVLIGAIVLTLYVVLNVFVLHKVIASSAKLKQRQNALSIILSEKKEVLLSQIEGFRSVKVNIRDTDEEVFEKIRALELDTLKAEEVHDVAVLLRDGQSRFNYLSGKNPWATKTNEYDTFTLTGKDLDSNYHRAVMAYNTDLTAYNYWNSIPLCHWIPFLLGYRKRERIA